MTGPIYNLFIVRRMREAYFHLTDEERDQYWSKVEKNLKDAGAKSLVMCESRWCNESTIGWGVEEFPDLKSLLDHTRENDAIGHYRYLDSESYLGMKNEEIQTMPVDIPDPIYQLFFIKNHNQDWDDLAKEEQDRIFGCVVESIQKHGGIPVVSCNCNWSNEEYGMFGVLAWPALAAQQAHFKDLDEIGWHRYIYAKTILGTPFR
jgi:hypothetical protein